MIETTYSYTLDQEANWIMENHANTLLRHFLENALQKICIEANAPDPSIDAGKTENWIKTNQRKLGEGLAPCYPKKYDINLATRTFVGMYSMAHSRFYYRLNPVMQYLLCEMSGRYEEMICPLTDARREIAIYAISKREESLHPDELIRLFESSRHLKELFASKLDKERLLSMTKEDLWLKDGILAKQGEALDILNPGKTGGRYEIPEHWIHGAEDIYDCNYGVKDPRARKYKERPYFPGNQKAAS